MPFTTAAFLETFATFNRDYWPVALAFWLATLAVLAHARTRPPDRRRHVAVLLAAMWLWNAIAYHALIFAAINPLAPMFAVAFALEAMFLAGAARMTRVAWCAGRGWRRVAGDVVAGYGLAYPVLSVVLHGHYPSVPTFAVPCPTTLVTLGIMLASPGVPRRLLRIPVAWAFVGGAAAAVFGMTADYALLVAGVGTLAAASRSPAAPADLIAPCDRGRNPA